MSIVGQLWILRCHLQILCVSWGCNPSPTVCLALNSKTGLFPMGGPTRVFNLANSPKNFLLKCNSSMSIVDLPYISQWHFSISCVSWGFLFSVTVEESPSSATLPRARLAYVGPAPERSHSLTDLSEAPLYRAGVFGLHGTSLNLCPLCARGEYSRSLFACPVFA